MEKTTVLTLNKDYKRLYYRGRSAVDPALVTYAMKNRLNSENRMGITVTKKIGKAVCRKGRTQGGREEGSAQAR